jgi:diguanylate cyclase (GGDEF)-like protein
MERRSPKQDKQLSGVIFVGATAVFALAGVTVTGGSHSPLLPLLTLPVILAVVRDGFPLVVAAGVGTAAGFVFLAGRAQGIGPGFQGQTLVLAMALVIISLIGGAYAQQVQRERESLIHTVEEQEALLNVSQVINAAETLEVALNSTLVLLRSLVPDLRSAAIYLTDENTRELVLAGHAGLVGDRIAPRRIPPDDDLSWSARENVPIVVPDTAQRSQHTLSKFDPAAGAAVCVAIRSMKVPIGLLVLTTDRAHSFPPVRVRLLEALADRAGYPIQKLRLQQDLRGLAETDSLTELHNVRAFRRRFEDEMRRSIRYGRPLSLIMVDLDDFKQINDRFGHPAGDRVLKGLAAILRESVRETDFPARYGGEEFVVLCPETPAPAAAVVAERIRSAVADIEMELARGDLRRFTCSVGVATFPEHAASAEDLLQAADSALYDAKRAGKNRVLSAPLPRQVKSA